MQSRLSIYYFMMAVVIIVKCSARNYVSVGGRPSSAGFRARLRRLWRWASRRFADSIRRTRIWPCRRTDWPTDRSTSGSLQPLRCNRQWDTSRTGRNTDALQSISSNRRWTVLAPGAIRAASSIAPVWSFYCGHRFFFRVCCCYRLKRESEQWMTPCRTTQFVSWSWIKREITKAWRFVYVGAIELHGKRITYSNNNMD